MAENARGVMSEIENTQQENITKAATVMADAIEKGRWVHTFGCGHATIPIQEMYPRIGGFVGFHPICELPLTFFTQIVGDLGVHQFVFLERVEGYGVQIMKGYNFDKEDVMWIFSHTGINNVNIDIALEAKKRGMTGGSLTVPPLRPRAKRPATPAERPSLTSPTWWWIPALRPVTPACL